VARVEWRGIACDESEATQVLELRMHEDALDEPVAESAAATVLDDEDVGEIGVGGEVGDDAREADLAITLEETERDGAGDGALDDVARDARRPVGSGQDAVHEIDVEPRAIGGEEDLVAPALEEDVVQDRDGTSRRLSLPR
jgi:hypothetical protein